MDHPSLADEKATLFGFGLHFQGGNLWNVLSDEQMRKIWPFSLLNDEQMSNWVGVKHLPDGNMMLTISLILLVANYGDQTASWSPQMVVKYKGILVQIS